MSEPSSILCRYYVNGCCSKGSACKFSHDRSTPSNNVCRYYLKGQCKFENGCRYDHVKPAPIDRVPQSNVSPPMPVASSSASSVSSISKLSPLAPVFVPRTQPSDDSHPLDLNSCGGLQSSYAKTVGDGAPTERHIGVKSQLCPYYSQEGSCYYGDMCTFTHGDICEFCLLAVLHPQDAKQRQEHLKTCVMQHEMEMEQAFAEAASEDKQCGICMEIVVEKKVKAQRRFGILQNCKHIFCLDCIRTWRNQDKFDMGCIRACPECRAPSDFVTPSAVWTDDEKAKTKIIDDYKEAMNKKSCKYFNKGKGECQFGNKCFYEHALPDGTIVQSDSPRTVRRRIKARNGETRGLPDVFVLWDWMDREFVDSDDSDFELELLQERFLEVLNFSEEDDDSSTWSDPEFDMPMVDLSALRRPSNNNTASAHASSSAHK